MRTKLRELFPSGRFANPASEHDIQRVEQELEVILPKSLSELLLESNGFRESTGNAKYLFSLTDEDRIGSILSVTKFMWSDEVPADLSSFVFFGSSSCDDTWGIGIHAPHNVIAYHYSMGDTYEEVGTDILSVYEEDFNRYDEA